MPLTFNLDLALNKTAGRKGGDESGPTEDHRVNKQTVQKRHKQYSRSYMWTDNHAGTEVTTRYRT